VGQALVGGGVDDLRAVVVAQEVDLVAGREALRVLYGDDQLAAAG
jgi:hypothetical protein